jgi:hypothetical protein
VSLRAWPAVTAIGRRAPWIVALLAFALYLVTACPTVYFGDSGELIGAADSLGVAHPPGYPIYTLLGRGALMLPGGEPAWRMNVMSGLFGALACAGVARLIQRWTASDLAALGAGLGLAVSFDVWAVATVTEVYTLHLGLIALLLLLADRIHDTTDPVRLRRGVLLLAVVLGVALGHRPTVVLAVPAVAVLALGLRRTRVRLGSVGWATWVAALAVVVAIPLVAYGSLVIRSATDPAVNWGRPGDLATLIGHVTTRSYRFYVLGPVGWLRPDGWARVVSLLWNGFGKVGLPLAVLGMLAALAGRPAGLRRPAVAVMLAAGGWLLFGLSYGTEDVEVLFLPVFLATALACGLGIAAIRSAGGRLPAAAVGLALLASPLALHGRAADLREVTAAADYGRDMLASVPEDGVLFVEGDDAFLLVYLRQVLHEREDVTIFDRNGLLFQDELRQAGSPPAAGENALLFRIRREQEFAVRTLRSSPSRAVMFMTWPGYEMPRGLRFEPHGLFYRVVASRAVPLDTSALWDAFHEERVIEQAERTGNPFALTVAATYPLMRGERSLFEGRSAEAAAWFDRASRLARNSETIHNYLGTIYGRLGDLNRAESEFLEAVRIKPVSIRAWNNLAQARVMSGDVDGARKAWKRSLEIEPAQPELRRMLRQHAQNP